MSPVNTSSAATANLLVSLTRFKRTRRTVVGDASKVCCWRLVGRVSVDPLGRNLV
jgi:hypothetical protein